MQMNGIFVSLLQVNAVVVVVMVVNDFLVDQQMREPLGALPHDKRCGPRQNLPKQNSYEDEGLAGTWHAQSIGNQLCSRTPLCCPARHRGHELQPLFFTAACGFNVHPCGGGQFFCLHA